MPLEVFTAYGAAGRLEATLRASGYLFLSSALLRRIHAEAAEAVVLLFDQEAKLLAVRAPRPDDPPPALRSVSKEPSGVAVNIVPLLASYNFPKPRRKLRLPVQTRGDMLLVEMKTVDGGEAL
jgi:hypothetical protein